MITLNQKKKISEYDEILNRQEVAEILGVSLNTVKELLEKPFKQGGIPNKIINPKSLRPRRIISKESLIHWLNQS